MYVSASLRLSMVQSSENSDSFFQWLTYRGDLNTTQRRSSTRDLEVERLNLQGDKTWDICPQISPSTESGSYIEKSYIKRIIV